jgi:hypothetical protein
MKKKRNHAAKKSKGPGRTEAMVPVGKFIPERSFQRVIMKRVYQIRIQRPNSISNRCSYLISRIDRSLWLYVDWKALEGCWIQTRNRLVYMKRYEQEEGETEGLPDVPAPSYK